MSADDSMVTCYNKGCGQKFEPGRNGPDACTHHPGAPVFHDAYKRWSCCGKKSTDFTEFLNFKGCTTSPHNPDKPVEEKAVVDKTTAEEVQVEVRAPVRQALPRPPLDTPLTKLEPKVAAGLVEQAQILEASRGKELADAFLPFLVPAVGTACKNNSCREQYEGAHSEQGLCLFHPGFPVFHEGLKFWSCCVKRTSDFDEFLKQKGCETGRHCWDKGLHAQVSCRYDWHQTSSHVTIAVYAKKYDPQQSWVKVSAVRAEVSLYFPEQAGAFHLPLELAGLVDVSRSSASMLPSKVELTLRKAEPGAWRDLFLPAARHQPPPPPSRPRRDEALPPEDLDAVDLTDL